MDTGARTVGDPVLFEWASEYKALSERYEALNERYEARNKEHLMFLQRIQPKLEIQYEEKQEAFKNKIAKEYQEKQEAFEKKIAKKVNKARYALSDAHRTNSIPFDKFKSLQSGLDLILNDLGYEVDYLSNGFEINVYKRDDMFDLLPSDDDEDDT